jgi:hypothetical protein
MMDKKLSTSSAVFFIGLLTHNDSVSLMAGNRDGFIHLPISFYRLFYKIILETLREKE